MLERSNHRSGQTKVYEGKQETFVGNFNAAKCKLGIQQYKISPNKVGTCYGKQTKIML